MVRNPDWQEARLLAFYKALPRRYSRDEQGKFHLMKEWTAWTRNFQITTSAPEPRCLLNPFFFFFQRVEQIILELPANYGMFLPAAMCQSEWSWFLQQELHKLQANDHNQTTASTILSDKHNWGKKIYVYFAPWQDTLPQVYKRVAFSFSIVKADRILSEEKGCDGLS